MNANPRRNYNAIQVSSKSALTFAREPVHNFLIRISHVSAIIRARQPRSSEKAHTHSRDESLYSLAIGAGTVYKLLTAAALCDGFPKTWKLLLCNPKTTTLSDLALGPRMSEMFGTVHTQKDNTVNFG